MRGLVCQREGTKPDQGFREGGLGGDMNKRALLSPRRGSEGAACAKLIGWGKWASLRSRKFSKGDPGG